MIDYFNLKLTRQEVGAVSVLGLAHIGDAVFELMVRSWLCSNGVVTAKKLHKLTVSYVSAKAQAETVKKLMPLLSEDEADVFRRGRNSRVNSVPRGASDSDYHLATGFETLFGYLYLSGETERLNELFSAITAD